MKILVHAKKSALQAFPIRQLKVFKLSVRKQQNFEVISAFQTIFSSQEKVIVGRAQEAINLLLRLCSVYWKIFPFRRSGNNADSCLQQQLIKAAKDSWLRTIFPLVSLNLSPVTWPRGVSSLARVSPEISHDPIHRDVLNPRAFHNCFSFRDFREICMHVEKPKLVFLPLAGSCVSCWPFNRFAENDRDFTMS